jgi:hypothetical protein
MLDQMGDRVRRPLNLADLARTQLRCAPGTAGLHQPTRPLAAQLDTDYRCALTRRATSDWLSPFRA